MTLLQLLQLIDRIEVDIAEPLHFPPKVGYLRFDLRPVLLLVFVLFVSLCQVHPQLVGDPGGELVAADVGFGE